MSKELTTLKSNELLLNEAIQANALIRAKYDYTKGELKLSRLIISQIRPHEQPKDRIYISQSKIHKYLAPNGKHGSIYDDIQKIIKSLNSKPIEISTKKEKMTIFWLGAHGVNKETGMHWFEIPKAMQPLLFALKGNFSSIPLHIYDKFRSPYPARLYEILYSYRHMRGGLVHYKKWQDLQAQLGASHAEYSNFKLRVLKKSQKELADKTDLRFEYEELKKKGTRKVEGLKFRVFYNKKEILAADQIQKEETVTLFSMVGVEGDGDNEIIAGIRKTLLGWGIHQSVIQKCLQDPFIMIDDLEVRENAKSSFGANKLNYLWDKMECTAQSKNIKDEAAFFLAAVKNNYQQNSSTKEKVKENKKNRDAEVRLQTKIQLEQQRADLGEKYYGICFDIMNNIFKEDPAYLKSATDKARSIPHNYYNQKLSLAENISDKNFFGFKVLSLIQKERPQFFGSFTKEYNEKMKQIDFQLKELGL